jgi:hypothetical protein
VGDIVLDTTALVVRPTAPIVAPGPTREVCLVPATPADDRAIQGTAPEWRRAVTVVLWGTGGARDTLGHVDSRTNERLVDVTRSDDSGAELCLWDHGLSGTGSATYVAVELRSSVRVHVRRIGFWSGRRTTLL